MVGAGVFGLSVAVSLQALGLPVTLTDPSPGAPNASSVAAGLIAPISEAIFDPVAASRYDLLMAAHHAWRMFAERWVLSVDRSGVVLCGDHSSALSRLGAAGEPHALGYWVADDRVENPATALRDLRAAFLGMGGMIDVRTWTQGDLRNPVVLAVGPGGSALTGLAPELHHLAPIKGQIAIAPHGPTDGPTLRWTGGYLAPQPGGARIGATMEPGRSDTQVEPEAIAALGDQALAYAPGLDLRDLKGQAGVRMGTPDGLPLVGPSRTPGVWLATGARRNGWLLAPLVGAIIAAYFTGNDPGPWAARMDPRRFEREGGF